MTRLKIRWEDDDGSFNEESWERGNDGVLYGICTAITDFIHAIGKLAKTEEGK